GRGDDGVHGALREPHPLPEVAGGLLVGVHVLPAEREGHYGAARAIRLGARSVLAEAVEESGLLLVGARGGVEGVDADQDLVLPLAGEAPAFEGFLQPGPLARDLDGFGLPLAGEIGAVDFA